MQGTLFEVEQGCLRVNSCILKDGLQRWTALGVVHSIEVWMSCGLTRGNSTLGLPP